MNENIKKFTNEILYAEYDNDLVGLCTASVNYLKYLFSIMPYSEFPHFEVPKNYVKYGPHLPRIELRKNFRRCITESAYLNEEDYTTKLKSVFIAIISLCLAYNISFVKLINNALDVGDFSRNNAKDLLLSDGMSTNNLKEPSNSDYSYFML